MITLADKHCTPCNSKVHPLSSEEVSTILHEVSGWILKDSSGYRIYRTFQFKNFYQTIAFINAVAWIANQENHHPRLEVEYNTCIVGYWTHNINGLSENDFICAAKINCLYKTEEINK